MNIYKLGFLLLLPFPFVAYLASEFPKSSVGQQIRTTGKPDAASVLFKSADGGQTWQDMTKELPGNLQRDGFIINHRGLYLSAGNEVYHHKTYGKAPFWEKDSFFDKQNIIAPGKNGTYAYNHWGQIFQKINGTGVWSPIYANFKDHRVLTVFETAGGTVFIGSNRGLFKTIDDGKTWKQVYTGGWVSKLVESNGILVATSLRGIERSTDGGENWESVISDDGAGTAIELIDGGLAAITSSRKSNNRRVRTSYDDGKTWQAIDAGLPQNLSTPNLSINSIIQLGDYLFCGHPKGIFRSSDKGKTWKLLLPSVEKKVFSLFVIGNVIYAIPSSGGC